MRRSDSRSGRADGIRASAAGTAITEKVKTEFRAEFFNAFNHPNFSVPVRDLGDGNFGRVTSTADPRIIQFGLKVLF